MAVRIPPASRTRLRLCSTLAVLAVLGILAVAALQSRGFLKKAPRLGKQLAIEAIVDNLDLHVDEINHGFQIHDGRVMFESGQAGAFLPKRVLTPVEGAEVATFRTFDQKFPDGERRVYYGADRRHVFFCVAGTIDTLDADAASFRLLDKAGRFACDKSDVYFQAMKIEGADSKTFRRLKGDFSVDDDQAFLGHVALPVDATTFQAFSEGYLWDTWHAGRRHEGKLSLEGWYGDASNIYFGDKRMEGIDPATFQYLGFRAYAKDASHVYYGEEAIESADSVSFEILGTEYANALPCTITNPGGDGPDARDVHQAYYRGSIFHGDFPSERN